MNWHDDKNIIACSSGEISCAISVIRISGKDYLSSINKFFSINIEGIEPRFASFCKIIDKDNVLDEVVCTFFKGPHSYNTEDILEISVHGNPINVQRIINLFLTVNSFRKAMPGEFSMRAVKNKKLSLSQVEGLDLLLNANSIFALDQGYSVLSGDLQDKFKQLLLHYKNHRSSLEFGFDFLEDIGEEQFKINLNESYTQLKETINSIYSQVANDNFNLLKPDITLIGLPNAGKSSLFNMLLNENRSIVSNQAGTTRDFVSETLNINNNIYKLIDTAGIRETEDFIEAEGVERALGLIKNSFFKILLIDTTSFDFTYYNKLKGLNFDLVIFTHADNKLFKSNLKKAAVEVLSVIGPIEPNKNAPIGPGFLKDIGPIEPGFFAPIEPLDIGPIEPEIQRLCDKSIAVDLSVKNGEAIKLINTLVDAKFEHYVDFDPVLIKRHAALIGDIHRSFDVYSKLFNENMDISVLSSELNIVGHCISELIGIVSADDILHNIFDNFCIGK